MNPRQDFWTEERFAQLQELIARELSSSQIAIEMGNTRSAVMGKIHRHGLSLANPPCLPKPRKRPKRNGGAVTAALKARQRQERKILAKIGDNGVKAVLLARATASGELPAYEKIKLPEEPLDMSKIALFDLKNHHCRWPIGEPGDPDFGFCGRRRADDATPYCEGHCRIAYTNRRLLTKQERERRRLLGKVAAIKGNWT